MLFGAEYGTGLTPLACIWHLYRVVLYMSIRCVQPGGLDELHDDLRKAFPAVAHLFEVKYRCQGGAELVDSDLGRFEQEWWVMVYLNRHCVLQVTCRSTRSTLCSTLAAGLTLGSTRRRKTK